MWNIKGLLLTISTITLFVACGLSHKSVVVDTSSNWLRPCNSSAQCGEALRCICRVCTIVCSEQDDCGDYDSNASCARVQETSFSASCSTASAEDSLQMCVLPCESDGDCSSLGDDSVCVDEQCIDRTSIIESTSTSPGRCDPFEEIDQPLRLGDLTVAARDSRGTIYAVYYADSVNGSDQLFVSEGDILYRKVITDNEFGNDDYGRYHVFNFDYGVDESSLLVENSADNGTRVAVVRDSRYQGRIDTMPEEGELLEVLSADDIQNMEKRNLPGIISIECLAEVENGKIMLVVRPLYDENYEDFDLFYGTPEEMKQYAILDVQRTRDGHSIWISFEIDSSTAEAVYPIYLDETEVGLEEPKVTIGDEKYGLTRLASGAMDLSEFVFVCDPANGLYEETPKVEISSIDVPLGDCGGCYIVNGGVWGFSESDLYIAGYVSDSSNGECNCQAHGFFRHFDGDKWSTLYETSEWAYMTKVWGSSPTDIYLLSGETVLYYDGEAMQDSGAVNNQYESIYGMDPSAVFAVGQDGVISHFNGNQWTIQPSGSTATLTGIWAASANDVFAVTDNGRSLHYDGNVWSPIDMTSIDDLEEGLNGVWGSARDSVFAISGSDHPDGTTGPGRIIAYNGREWFQEQAVQKDALLAISGSSQRRIHAVGGSRDSDGTSHGVIWSYNGARWERTLLTDVEAFLWDIWCSPEGVCFVVGTDNTMISLDK